MKDVIFDFGDDPVLFDRLVAGCAAKPGVMKRRHFPDGDSYLRFKTPCKNACVFLLCSLDRPNPKILPLLLSAETLRSLGASQVILVAPYLAYMRQDAAFAKGEGVSARYFARLLSDYFDGLVTVDPHLHRIHTLDEVYSIPSEVVHASATIAEWIAAKVSKPVLIGPDVESKQWVADVAARINAPFLILEKTRTGDRKVSVSVPDLAAYRESTPVLVDDIISTGRTMVAAIEHLMMTETPPPVCVAIHGVFSRGSAEALFNAGAAAVVSTNTITHVTNMIDLSAAIAEACHAIKQRLPTTDSLPGE